MRTAIYTIGAVIVGLSSAAADPVDTFRKLCLTNAPDPQKIEKSALNDGFKESALAEFYNENGSFIGNRKSTDETVQVNIATRHAFECAVTTSSEGNPDATRERFFGSLSLKPRGNLAQGSINGTTYTFKYDPEGGEAFVMYIPTTDRNS